jgi:hypothetical protein
MNSQLHIALTGVPELDVEEISLNYEVAYEIIWTSFEFQIVSLYFSPKILRQCCLLLTPSYWFI